MSQLFVFVFFLSCLPADGSLSLTYCPQDEEGYQAFEVLQSWTPQILGSVAQPGADGSGEGMQGILSSDGSQIIVQALGVSLRQGHEHAEIHQFLLRPLCYAEYQENED